MPRVYLRIGSNVAREANIAGALTSLRERFAPLTVSPVYESKAVGFDGPRFRNLVVGFDTDLDLLALHGALCEVEHRHGRRSETPRYDGGSRVEIIWKLSTFSPARGPSAMR